MINKAYKINDGRVISETLDGETIIINLDNGNYYSTNKTAAIIWNQIESNNGTQNILNHFLNLYEAEEDIVEKSIHEIINFLLKDNLILESELNIGQDNKEEISNISKELFLAPQIEKYDDMKEMLLADPVHDVDEKDGWPNLR